MEDPNKGTTLSSFATKIPLGLFEIVDLIEGRILRTGGRGGIGSWALFGAAKTCLKGH